MVIIQMFIETCLVMVMLKMDFSILCAIRFKNFHTIFSFKDPQPRNVDDSFRSVLDCVGCVYEAIIYNNLFL